MLHAQAYGEAVDAVTLIPHMLEAFMAGDRGFRKGGASKAVPPKAKLTMQAQSTGYAFAFEGVLRLVRAMMPMRLCLLRRSYAFHREAPMRYLVSNCIIDRY